MILLSKRETLETLKRAENIRKHDISNMVIDNEFQFPHIIDQRKSCQFSAMKSYLIKIDGEQTRLCELLNARLNKIDSFETDNEDCPPKRRM